jgi:hypothetical protein
MRTRFFATVAAAAVGLAVVAASGTAAGAGLAPTPTAGGKATFGAHPAQVAGAIYSQLDNDNGVAIVSQHFETRFLSFDSQGADDFTIARKAVVKQVVVDGLYFKGTGPANSVHLTFYRNAGGAPGTVVQDIPHAPFTDATGTGTFRVTVPKVTLKAGTYWLSVFVNMPFRLGEWGWLTNNRVRHKASLWRNPLDGFSTGCTSWERTTDCVLADEGGDFAFALLGKGH